MQQYIKVRNPVEGKLVRERATLVRNERHNRVMECAEGMTGKETGDGRWEVWGRVFLLPR